MASGKAGSVDLRERAVFAYEDSQGTYQEIADRFMIGRTTLCDWVRLSRYAGTLEPIKDRKPPSNRSLDEACLAHLLALAEATPDATRAELALQAVEANHRLEKGPLRLQPCYHRKTSRIEAHVMLNILTVNCIRHLERLTGTCYQHLVDLFKPLKAPLFDDGERLYWQRTDLTADQTAILEKLKIKSPPTSWSTWIEVQRDKPKSPKKGPSSRKGRSR